jgi:hypothetical protein
MVHLQPHQFERSGAVVTVYGTDGWPLGSFVQVGACVHRHYANGNTVPVCEGLHNTGPTLMVRDGETLEAAITRTMR